MVLCTNKYLCTILTYTDKHVVYRLANFENSNLIGSVRFELDNENLYNMLCNMIEDEDNLTSIEQIEVDKILDFLYNIYGGN